MSFLNPVNEPVKRFSSTDADAPQINYNARVAGDVKTVLKACLVTGYGDKASAGWSIVNEVDHVAEFVSPSAAMSDYRLGVDDSTTTKTDWYYQYQDARVSPSYSNPTKSFGFADKTHVSNGWQLLVTARGMVFIETVLSVVVNKLSSRLTYFSQIKSGLETTGSANIAFFNIGNSASISQPRWLYDAAYPHFRLESESSARIIGTTPYLFSHDDYAFSSSLLDIATELYLAVPTTGVLIGRLAGVILKAVNNPADTYGLTETTIDSRPMLSVCAGYGSTNMLSITLSRGRTFLLPLDYWEY